MPKLQFKEVAPQHEVATITVEPADYEKIFHNKLKEYAAKADFKGFRKGKAPLSFVKKVAGKQLLGEIIEDLFNQELKKIENRETFEKNLLLGPITKDQQGIRHIDPFSPQSYTLEFDLAIAPNFELEPFDSSKVFIEYVLHVEDEKVEDEYQKALKYSGELVDVDGPIQQEDRVIFLAHPKDGQSEDLPKEPIEFSLTILEDRLSSEFHETIIGKSKGDQFDFEIGKIFPPDMPRERCKQILGVEDDSLFEEGKKYQLEIKEIKRLKPVEPTEEGLQRIFGEEIKTEEQAKELIRNYLKNQKAGDANFLLYESFKNYLLDLYREKITLPEELIQDVLKKDDKEGKTDPHVFMDYLRWQLLQGKLIEHFQIEVNSEEVLEHTRARIRSQFGHYADDTLITSFAQRLLSDRKKVRETVDEILNIKLLKKLKEDLTVEQKAVSEEEFEEILNNFLKKDTQNASTEAEGEATASTPEQPAAQAE
ncbi:MAG: peptidylprolyl isomerase [Saprospiraceae bacterium]|nr:MAG: peptidylprolyl isomerase [Saprospiraceae bacterium]